MPTDAGGRRGGCRRNSLQPRVKREMSKGKRPPLTCRRKKFKKGLASLPSFGNIYLALQRVVFHTERSKQVGVAELADALA